MGISAVESRGFPDGHGIRAKYDGSEPDDTWRQYLLTLEERDSFAQDGYIVIPNALRPEHLARLTREVARCRRDLQERRGVGETDRFLLLDFLGLSDEFLDLIDHPAVFPKVWGLLGWNIQVYHTHLCVAPGMGASARPAPCDRQHFIHAHQPELDADLPIQPADLWKWHRDSGRVNQDLGAQGPHPMLSVKVAYFLSDTLADDCGQMMLVPGSHRDRDVQRRPPPDGTLPEGAIPIRVPAGTALLFDRRLYHSSSPNLTGQTRQVLTYGYSYRWFRPRDAMTIAPAQRARCGPIRRQLLGEALSGYGYSSPIPAEVPLRAWLEQRGIDAEPSASEMTLGGMSPGNVDAIPHLPPALEGGRLGPWANRLQSEDQARLGDSLQAWEADPERRVVYGISACPPRRDDAGVLVMAGSDVSGRLHWGHLYNLLTASLFAHAFETDVTLTLNEPESVLSRGDAIPQAQENRDRIMALLRQYRVNPHSRLNDEHLMLLAFALFKACADPARSALLAGFYGWMPDSADLLSICVMAATPAALARTRNASSVFAVYGKDELAHVCLMEHLYQTDWFRALVERMSGHPAPAFGFAVTHLVPGRHRTPDGKPEEKMSKTLARFAVPFESTGESQNSVVEPFRELLALIDRHAPGMQANPMLRQVREMLRQRESLPPTLTLPLKGGGDLNPIITRDGIVPSPLEGEG